MPNLTLTVMDRGPGQLHKLKELLRFFEMRYRATVTLRVFTWESGWEEVGEIAKSGMGADVSEIGSTWLGSLQARGALRALSREELSLLGTSFAHYLPTSWDSCQVEGGNGLWAVPWLIDTRVLYFRRDLLAEAGLDEATALATPDALRDTLARLAQRNTLAPWVLPTTQSLEILHNIASWVWGAGGEFVAPDGRSTRFAEEPALRGMAAYFDLYRFLPEALRGLDAVGSSSVFRRGEAAMTLAGPWLLSTNPLPGEGARMAEEVRAQMDVALPPGVPFVGGSHLAIWKQSRHANLAVELVGYLTSVESQHAYCRGAAPIPARLFTLHTPPFNEPHYQMMARGLRAGRSFKPIPRWGLVESELSGALNDLSQAVLAAPDSPLLPLLRRRLTSVAQQLDAALAQSPTATP